MLFRLEIENFYSIRDRQVLDLRVSDKSRKLPERFTPIHPGSHERVPKVMATFGANAAGKTNLLRAVAFLAWFVRDSFQLQPEAGIPIIPFQDAEWSGRPTRIAASVGGRTDLEGQDELSATYGTYEYELIVAHRTGGPSYVAAESLRHRMDGKGKSVRLFQRTARGDILDGPNFPLAHYRSIVGKVRSNASLISTLAQFDFAPAVALRNASRTVVTNLFVVQQNLSDEQLIGMLAGNPSLLESLNREIPRIDLGVRNLRVESDGLRPIAKFEHEGLSTPIVWALESHGTQSFVRSFPLIASALRTGGLALIDELDASLHPLMLSEIAQWFYDTSRNPLNARLWLTCQNPAFLEQLEKEEVIFCEKDRHGRTRVYGLQDIKNVRRIDNYYRKYLSGAYGAVPIFG
ncbi:MAG TPA: ATP-binding protein [Alphaproteobacteria bacterium]